MRIREIINKVLVFLVNEPERDLSKIKIRRKDEKENNNIHS